MEKTRQVLTLCLRAIKESHKRLVNGVLIQLIKVVRSIILLSCLLLVPAVCCLRKDNSAWAGSFFAQIWGTRSIPISAPQSPLPMLLNSHSFHADVAARTKSCTGTINRNH